MTYPRGEASGPHETSRWQAVAVSTPKFSTGVSTYLSRELTCPRCGVIDHHREETGQWGPHQRRLICQDCGAFIRWLPKLREDAGDLPPTGKQLHYLRTLRYRGQPPQNRLEASELIDALKRGRAGDE